ncbi:MAG: hypothetical protein A2284_14935 [Deltaproteobacteria bacterium RIFOXYA12_FULL_61_11]|nr:MAG: hypothetical protein A2284_14935 [Deltaproteobacteria bacterium RIFOXYA12_FULL_61_11]
MVKILLLSSFLALIFIACSDDEENASLLSSSSMKLQCSKCTFDGSVTDQGNGKAKASVRASDGKEFTKEFAIPEPCKGQGSKLQFGAMDLTSQAQQYCQCQSQSTNTSGSTDTSEVENKQDACLSALFSQSFSLSGLNGSSTTPTNPSGSGTDLSGLGGSDTQTGLPSGTGTGLGSFDQCTTYQTDQTRYGACLQCAIAGQTYDGTACSGGTATTPGTDPGTTQPWTPDPTPTTDDDDDWTFDDDDTDPPVTTDPTTPDDDPPPVTTGDDPYAVCDQYSDAGDWDKWGDCYGCVADGKPYSGVPCQ